jgi:hypothetical protein
MEVRESRTFKGFVTKARILGQRARFFGECAHYIINGDWGKFTGDRRAKLPMILAHALRGEHSTNLRTVTVAPRNTLAMNRKNSSLASIVLLLGLICQGGCVALNLPSERIADPSDKGGLFGHWRGTARHHSTTSNRDFAMRSEGSCVDSDCWDGGPLGEDSCETCEDAEPAAPEVPWPRFLPVPTRPVFGSPGTQATFDR